MKDLGLMDENGIFVKGEKFVFESVLPFMMYQKNVPFLEHLSDGSVLSTDWAFPGYEYTSVMAYAHVQTGSIAGILDIQIAAMRHALPLLAIDFQDPFFYYELYSLYNWNLFDFIEDIFEMADAGYTCQFSTNDAGNMIA